MDDFKVEVSNQENLIKNNAITQCFGNQGEALSFCVSRVMLSYTYPLTLNWSGVGPHG